MRFFALLAALPLARAASLLPPLPGLQQISNQYIVVMKPEAEERHLREVISHVTGFLHLPDPKFIYSMDGFKGFHLSSPLGLITSLLSFEYIHYIEPDTKVYVSQFQTQSPAPWGLSRISHQPNVPAGYDYDSSAGADTWSYIIDTGIYIKNEDFEGRATFLANFAGDGQNTDSNGHGTHVAGTVGGKRFGVAKKTNLVAIKVLDARGGGSSSGVIKGIELAAQDAANKGRIGRAIANLSLGGPRSRASNEIAAAAVRKGLFLAVAAGNSGQPAADFSPASEATVCTVGATDRQDARAPFSNFGNEVDVFAPGVEIVSTWIGNPSAVNTLSGTSMACPHVGGLAAYLLRLEGPRSPRDLCQRIIDLSTKDKVRDARSPSRLAFNGQPRA